jgi:hypothetical protein
VIPSSSSKPITNKSKSKISQNIKMKIKAVMKKSKKVCLKEALMLTVMAHKKVKNQILI